MNFKMSVKMPVIFELLLTDWTNIYFCLKLITMLFLHVLSDLNFSQKNLITKFALDWILVVMKYNMSIKLLFRFKLPFTDWANITISFSFFFCKQISMHDMHMFISLNLSKKIQTTKLTLEHFLLWIIVWDLFVYLFFWN